MTTPAEGSAGPARGKWKPHKWELLLAGEFGHPCAACWCFFLLGWVFAFALIAKIVDVKDAIFSFELEPVRSSLVVQAHHGFTAARGKAFGCRDDEHEKEHVCKADRDCEWNSRAKKCSQMELCPALPSKPRSNPLRDASGDPGWVAVIYEAVDGANILDNEVLGHIKNFETELLTTANGAQRKGGRASPWKRDWCMKVYPAGDNSTGRCLPPLSLVGMFTMTEGGRSTVERQVMEGYSSIGGSIAACVCGHQDEMCAICRPDGTLRGVFDVERSVRNCLWRVAAATPAAPPAGTASAGAGSPAAASCSGQGGMPSTGPELLQYASGFCATKPTCQWSPPGTGFCASTGYYASDWGDLVTGAEKEAVINKMCDENNQGWWNIRKRVLPRGFSCAPRRKVSKFAMTSFFPGAGGVDDESAFADWKGNYMEGRHGWYAKARQLERRIEEDSGGKLRIILYSAATARTQMLEVLIVDLLLSLFSLFLVWAYMAWTLESSFLASCAMFEIVFSVPVAFCWWALVLQRQIIFTQVLCIYIILGIGADDAFILYDAWLQARFAGEEVMENWMTRFAYAYRKSFHTMLITTVTTCGSFAIGATSPLPMVRDFCIFAAVVVLVDWLFCITFFASAVVVFERYFKSDREPGQCRGPGCCWGAARAMSRALCGKMCYSAEAPETPSKRGMERFCEGPLFDFLAKWKLPLVFAWVAVIAGGAVSAGVQLRTAQKRSPVGRENIDAIRGLEILTSEFSFRGVAQVSFFYGLDAKEPIEEWNGADGAVPRFGSLDSLVSPRGQVELLQLCRAADLGTEANTRCDSGTRCLVLGRGFGGRCPRNERAWRAQGVYLPDNVFCENGRYCFMETFADFWAATKGGCIGRNQSDCTMAAAGGCAWGPPAAQVSPVCYSTTEPANFTGLPEAEFLSLLTGADFAAYMERRKRTLLTMERLHDVEAEPKRTGWRAARGSELGFAWVSFNASIPNGRRQSMDETNGWYSRWENFKETHGPSLGGFQTTETYLFMVIQNEMVKAAVMGVVLSLLVAYLVVMLTTQNVQLSSLGILNIIGICSVFLGIMPLLGWSLGENECIFLIAVVGLSVDYSVHLLVSYSCSGGNSRQERARHALGEMGISVLNSSITTLLASVILFGCGIFFLFQFGAFIFCVIGLSILMSITFMIPLLLLLGPEGDAGNFRCRFCRRHSWTPGSLPLPGWEGASTRANHRWGQTPAGRTRQHLHASSRSAPQRTPTSKGDSKLRPPPRLRESTRQGAGLCCRRLPKCALHMQGGNSLFVCSPFPPKWQ